MTLGDRIALAWTPLFLRTALAVTFLWAGLGKVMSDMGVRGSAAASLANMGVLAPASANPATTPSSPTAPAPGPGPAPGPAAPAPSTAPGPSGPAPSPGPDAPASPPAIAPPAQPLPPASPRVEHSAPAARPALPEAPNTDADHALTTSGARMIRAAQKAPSATAAPAPASASPAAAPAGASTAPRATPRFGPGDFPDEVRVRRVYGLALLMERSAFPAARDDGTPRRPLWPAALARGSWPVRLAWAVAITELVGGVFVLLGLLTRVSALALAGTMVGAMWLTELGPALQAGKVVLGVLPDHAPYSVESWKTLLWQFALFMMAMGLACAGPGVAALDRALFAPSRRGGSAAGAAPAAHA